MRFHLPSSSHTIKPGTPENGTRNTDGTAEHSGTPTEHQRNTSGTPRNNGTLHDEEQLHLNVDYKLKFNEHLESILKMWNLVAYFFPFWQDSFGKRLFYIFIILPYKSFERRRIIMNFFLRHSWFLLLPFSKDVLQS